MKRATKEETTKKKATAKTPVKSIEDTKAKTSVSSEEVADQKPTWKKVTRGSLYPFPGKRSKRVKPNETIQATEAELSHVKEHFQLVKDGTGVHRVKAIRPEEPEFISPVKGVYAVTPAGEGLYNIVSPGGKVMNEVGLSLEDAEDLKEELEEETEED